VVEHVVVHSKKCCRAAKLYHITSVCSKVINETRATTSCYIGGDGAQMHCNLLLHLIIKHIFLNVGGGNCPVFPSWFRDWVKRKPFDAHFYRRLPFQKVRKHANIF